jgi:hypothetical protein
MNPYATESVCDNCPSAFQCGKLSMALAVLKQLAQDADAERKTAIQSFFDKLQTYGFDYQAAIHPCQLAGKQPLVNDLIREAITLTGYPAVGEQSAKNNFLRELPRF